MIADRLVNDLMLVSVLVAGEGAAAFAQALEAAGAAADVHGDAPPQPGFDLAILLAAPESAGDAATLVASLAGASDRLLFAPLPLRDDSGGEPRPLPSLNDWFEVFAEHGYQPVVDFDADFVASGAFLVDRQATAAEGELAAFADRLQNPAPAASRAAPPDDGEKEALRAEIAALQAQIAALSAVSQPELSSPQTEAAGDSGWDALAPWVNRSVADPARNSQAAFAHDLPRLLELRGPDAPPLGLPAPVVTELRRRWLNRLFRREPPPPLPKTPAVLDDIALVRASKYFDAAWYIASTPELLAGEPLDPVFHYVLVGALRGADPGPWFNTAAYVAAHPEAADGCALVHAIRTAGEDGLAALPEM